MGTAIERHQSRTEVHSKAAGYGIEAMVVDGMDVAAVEAAMHQAMDYVRAGRPFFLEARTYRFRAHSMYDAELYRSKEEVEQWKLRDPIVLWEKRLRAQGDLSDDDIVAIDADVAAQVKAAVEFAEQGEWEPTADLLKDVYTGVNP
jgi:TPP-dependent pyruvate/acetoin dehydrogenase alpha subunit